MYISIVGNLNRKILSLISDVESSPQLVEIYEKLHYEGAIVRIILIGKSNLKIAEIIKQSGWHLTIVQKRGRYGSLINLPLILLEILKFRPQVVFSSGQFATVLGMFSAWICLVPSRIHIRHHSSLHFRYGMKFGIVIDQICNRFSTKIIAVSTVVREVLVGKESVPLRKIVVIPNGVDIQKFRKSDNTSESNTTQPRQKGVTFRIGVISRLTEWKGVEYTAKAFIKLQKEFPFTVLEIVGAFSDSYPRVTEILSEVQSKNYNLKELNTNIPQFLNEIDVFVHVPIGRDDEAFGIVYIEALASGTKSIFTKSGILNELEDPDLYAYIVPFRNSEEIYLNLKSLIQEKHSPKITIPEIWIQQYSLDKMATKYVELIIGSKNE